MVDVFSSIHNPPSCQLFRIRNTNGTAEGLVLNPIGWLHESKPPENFYNYPELYSYQISSGDKLYSMVLKPHNMEPGKKYPVVLCVYGGPEVQLVSNTFKGKSHLLQSKPYKHCSGPICSPTIFAVTTTIFLMSIKFISDKK